MAEEKFIPPKDITFKIYGNKKPNGEKKPLGFLHVNTENIQTMEDLVSNVVRALKSLAESKQNEFSFWISNIKFFKEALKHINSNTLEIKFAIFHKNKLIPLDNLEHVCTTNKPLVRSMKEKSILDDLASAGFDSPSQQDNNDFCIRCYVIFKSPEQSNTNTPPTNNSNTFNNTLPRNH